MRKALNTIKSVLKKLIVNIKFIINSFLKMHRCILCNSEKSLSLVFKGWPYYYLKCNSCDLIFVGNFPSERSYRLLAKNSHFGRHQMIKKTNWQDWQNWKIETYRNLELFNFEKTLQEKEKQVLEIGCAEGRQLDILQKRGWQVLGVEPNKYSAQECKNLGLDVLNEYFENIALPNRSFDLVIATHTLEHSGSPHTFIQKVFQSLKDNGRLVLEVPLTIDTTNAEHLFYFCGKSLAKLLKDNHFTIIKEFRYTDKIYQCGNLSIMAKKAEN